MSGKRLEKLNSQLIREISDILLRKISDPRLQWVTISQVNITPDLHEAKIFFNTLTQDEKQIAGILEALKHAAGYIRHELGNRLLLRVMPELHFMLDEKARDTQRVYELISQLQEKKEGETDG